MRTEAIQKKLLTEADLTVKRAQEIAQSMESADKSAKDLKGDTTPRPTESVNLAAPVRTQEKARPCYRCGRRHDPKLCKFREAKCHKCRGDGSLLALVRQAQKETYDVLLLESFLGACSPTKILDFSASDSAPEAMFGQNRL